MGIIKESLLNIRSRWITFIVGVLLIAISFSVYIAIDSAVGSVNAYTNGGVLNNPLYRVAMTFNDEEYVELGGDLERLVKDERVQGIFKYSYPYFLFFENSEELIKEKADSVKLSWYANIFDEYITEGRKIQNKGEILLPQYLANYGNMEGYREFNDDYIGKTVIIKKEIESQVTEEIAETVYYEFEVVGIYDNSKASTDCWFLINDEEFAEISMVKTIGPETEEDYEIMAERTGYTVEELKQSQEGISQKPGCTGIYTYNYKQAEEIVKEYGILPVAKHTPMELKQMEMLSYAGTFISFIIMLVGLINILISIIHNIGKREWEYALKLAVGYKRVRLYAVLAIELIITSLTGMAIGLAVSYFIIDFVKEKYIKDLMLHFISMEFPVLPVSFFKGMTVIGIAIVISFVIGCWRISDIKVSEALRMEE